MRNRIPILCLSAVALSSVALAVNDIEPTKEYYTARYAPKPIVLDGDLGEWSGVPVLADPKFAIPKFSGTNSSPNYVLFEEYNGGTWTGPDDQTSAVQIVFDTDNVYFGFVVTDDYHENSANSAWNGDSVQLMIASGDRTTQIALYNYALGGVEGAIGDVIVNHEAGPAADEACGCATEAVIKRNSVTKKTTYEIKLPKAALGLTNLANLKGAQFGLGMAINDGDELTPGQKGWGGLGCHAIVFGKTPSETALMTLAKGNDIEPTKEYYTALRTTNAITLDGVFSEWSGVPILADPKFAIPKFSGTNDLPNYVLFEEYNGGTWTGPADQTSAVQIAYDADNIYFGFVVTDDYHENAANSAWNGDSVQLMIASADRTTQVALYNYALGGIEGAIGDVIVNHEAGPAVDEACACATEALVRRDGVNKKTYYEIKLPAASCGLTAPLTAGMKFGLGMAINDGDELTPGQKGWGGLGAHAIVFGKTPQETAEVTLGTTASGTDLLFLSAVNTTLYGFSFRANDKGSSIVAPATAKLTIDGQVVALTVSPKVLDATDFTYTRATMFAFGTHTYSIEVRDSVGGVVTDTGTFITPVLPTLTKAMQAVNVDKTKPGFIWRVFQNEAYLAATLAECELALAGNLTNTADSTVLDNLAEPANTGPALANGTLDGKLYKFEIPTVINLSQAGGDYGGFPTDDMMPGIPGVNFMDDGIDAEITTFVELPAGLITLGVQSDDSFGMQAGYINVPADRVLVTQFQGVSTTTQKIVVEEAGIYPIRVIYQEGGGDAYIELFSVKPEGTKVLLNDTANGGYKTYRAGTVPAKPTIFNVAIGASGGQISITWTQTGVVLQECSDLSTKIWTTVSGATSPYHPTTAGQTAKYYRLKQ